MNVTSHSQVTSEMCCVMMGPVCDGKVKLNTLNLILPHNRK